MKIVINESAGQPEPEVVINCRQADETVLRMVAALHALERKLSGVKDGRMYLIDLQDVLYFDTVDKRAFIYTKGDVYETDKRLYELLGLSGDGFFRASKSAVVNIAKITAILPDFGGRLEIVLQGGEKLGVSRQYARDLKEKLGI